MFKPRLDWWLVIPVILLSSLGLVVLRSVSPQLVGYQLLFLLASTAAFLFFSSLDHRVPFSLHLPLFVISLLSLLAPLIFGAHTRGAFRWIQLGQFSLQPSEIAKPLFLLVFASIGGLDSKYRTVWLFILYLLPAGLIYLQPDLGTTLVLSVGWLTILFSKTSLKSISVAVLMSLIVFPLGQLALRPYQRDRLLTFINPTRDPLGRGYHVIQSLIAVGSGQIFGRGLGHGTQSQLKFLPEYHTDFVFASLTEELGFVGGILVIILFLFLLRRIYSISQTAPSVSASLFCLSSLAMLAFQIFINIGMNMGLAPVTGITLPFLSYGGSSLLSLGVLLGLLNSISAASVKIASDQI